MGLCGCWIACWRKSGVASIAAAVNCASTGPFWTLRTTSTAFVRLFQWLLDTYLPDQKLLPRTHLFELAIEDAHLPLLEWLCRDNKGAFPPLKHHVTYSDPDTVIHLHEYGGDISRVQLLLGRCRSNASLQSICRCLALED